MSNTDYTEGFYVLEQDLKNPKPDRRVKHERRCRAVWKAGTRLRLVKGNDVYSWRWQFLDDRYPNLHEIPESDDRFAFLLHHAVHKPEDWRAFAQRIELCNYADDVFEMAVEDGWMSRETVEKLVEKARQRDIERWEAKEKAEANG